MCLGAEVVKAVLASKMGLCHEPRFFRGTGLKAEGSSVVWKASLVFVSQVGLGCWQRRSCHPSAWLLVVAFF